MCKNRPSEDEQSDRGDVDSETGHDAAVCPRCNGLGLVCGVEPDTEQGCVDFLNATCPECHGTGRS